MNINHETINQLESQAHDLDQAIDTITVELSRCDLSDIQRATVNTLYGELWNASGKVWDLLHSLDRRVPPFGRHLPDDWPLAG